MFLSSIEILFAVRFFQDRVEMNYSGDAPFTIDLQRNKIKIQTQLPLSTNQLLIVRSDNATAMQQHQQQEYNIQQLGV